MGLHRKTVQEKLGVVTEMTKDIDSSQSVLQKIKTNAKHVNQVRTFSLLGQNEESWLLSPSIIIGYYYFYLVHPFLHLPFNVQQTQERRLYLFLFIKNILEDPPVDVDAV